MNTLTLIKKRRTIRLYKSKKIPNSVVKKIIDAGIWGPSVAIYQPWHIVVVTNGELRRRINGVISKKVKNKGVVGTVLLSATARAMSKAPMVIFVYATGEFVNFAKRFGKDCEKFARIAEICATSATIQNMLLVAEDLGVGGCWHDTPLFCEKEINKLLQVDHNLIAALTLGYPAERGNRAKRKEMSLIVKYLK